MIIQAKELTPGMIVWTPNSRLHKHTVESNKPTSLNKYVIAIAATLNGQWYIQFMNPYEKIEVLDSKFMSMV
jgi:hypothetical protein